MRTLSAGLGPCYFRTTVGGEPIESQVFLTGYATGWGPGPGGTSVQVIAPFGPGVGPVQPGPSLPGGTAGFPTAAQRGGANGPAGGGWLSGLSHTTAGLNWTTLALWLAILAGAYIVLDHYARGGRRRRR